MKQGFTLLELLITIAILAVLTTVIVVAINPAESIKRARDTQRMSDLDNLKTGIILYISEGYTDIGATTCGAGAAPDCKSYCCYLSATSLYGCPCAGDYSSYDNNNKGWIPIAFTDMAGGSPLSHLPVDPLSSSSGTNEYSYAAVATDFELNAVMESAYYTTGKDINKVMEKDGGNQTGAYEVGTKLTIITP